MLKYFDQLPTPRDVQAILKNVKEDKAWVTLMDYCYDIPLPSAELAGLEPGDELTVSLDQINPRKSRLYARKVSLAPDQDDASEASGV